MIEQGIYFALGCIVTALFALLFAPVFWRRALRLSRQRLQLQVPLSMQEILAERDGLRAVYAVERLRLEQEIARVRDGKVRDMAEIGRRSSAESSLTDAVADLRGRVEAQNGEIERLKSELAAAPDRSIIQQAFEALTGAGQDETAPARAEGATGRAGDGSRTRPAEDETDVRSLRERLDAAISQAARHEASGLSSTRELEGAKALLTRLEDELVAAQTEAAAARDREQAMNLQNSFIRARGVDLSERLAEVEAENASLRRDIEVFRSTAKPVVAASDGDGGTRDLRASIHALGLAVAEMKGEIRDRPRPAERTGAPVPATPDVAAQEDASRDTLADSEPPERDHGAEARGSRVGAH